MCVCETGPTTTTMTTNADKRRPSICDKAVKTKCIDDDFDNDGASMSRPLRCHSPLQPDLSSLLGREDDEPRS